MGFVVSELISHPKHFQPPFFRSLGLQKIKKDLHDCFGKKKADSIPVLLRQIQTATLPTCQKAKSKHDTSAAFRLLLRLFLAWNLANFSWVHSHTLQTVILRPNPTLSRVRSSFLLNNTWSFYRILRSYPPFYVFYINSSFIHLIRRLKSFFLSSSFASK